MESVAIEGDVFCAVYVDMGTTNTRVWLARGDQVLARAKAPVGVRETARAGSAERLRATLRDLIAAVRAEVNRSPSPCVPTGVVAAGMITSDLGLAEVPHVPAPAGAAELTAAAPRRHFPDVTELPVLLIPGVRSGPPHGDLETIENVDIMRGEETLCAGLVTLDLIKTPGAVLSLGSHWKAIRLDAEGRVRASITSLSGELIHAAQTQTILASAVPPERPVAIDPTWAEAGMQAQRRSGLARALFCVRLLEQAQQGTPDERLAFLIGAFIAADRDGWMARGVFNVHDPVVITGGGPVAEAWRRALAEVSVPAVALTDAETESALLAGLRRIGEAAALV